jgi:squalene synthase HpnD
MGYCQNSANPVGRFLLDLHGEGATGHGASDALCAALQIINHVQDCQDDYRDIDRVYLPLDLFATAGIGVEALDAAKTGPALRWVLDRVLDGVDELVAAARPLASTIGHGGMRREASVIVALAEALARELRIRDPLAERVELSRWQKLACVWRGLWRAMTDTPQSLDDPAAAYARSVVQRAGSSFYGAMRLLPRDRREAMYAVYAFCRRVDDIADGPGPAAAKQRALADWNQEIDALYAGRPGRMISQALAEPVARYGLRRDDFEEILRGVDMDANGPVVAPAMAELELYCARVAGAVGLLSVRVFGCRDARADEFALAVGEALQLTNILRDVAEDASDGRLYLPREALDAAGIASREPLTVAAHPALPEACAAVAAVARERYGESRAMLMAMTAADRALLRPAVVMMTVYDRLLERLVAGGWRRPEERVRVPKAEKMWIALRHGVM